MKRDFLKGLGLTDDTIDLVMAEVGKDTNKNIEKMNEQAQEILKLNETIAKYKDYDSIVKQLEEANKTIETQKADIETAKTTYDEGILGLKKDNAIKIAVMSSKPIDEVAYLAHLDMSKITYDAETNELTGFKEQDEAIRKNQAYLFEPQSTGTEHGSLNGNVGQADDIYSAVAEHYKK